MINLSYPPSLPADLHSGVADTLDIAVIGTVETPFTTTHLFKAGTLGNGSVYHIKFIGSHFCGATPPALQFRVQLVKAGPVLVNLFASGLPSLAANINDRSFVLEFMLVAVAAPSAASPVDLSPVLFWPPGANGMNTVIQPVNVDTLSDQTLDMAIIASAVTAGTNKITLRHLLVQRLR